MKKLLSTLAVASCAATSPAWAHAVLKAAVPAAGGTTAAGVQELRLTFNEALEATFCKVQVLAADSKPLATHEVKAAEGDAKTLVVPLEAPAKSGTYTVHWSAMGHDGHRTKGDYKFTVK